MRLTAILMVFLVAFIIAGIVVERSMINSAREMDKILLVVERFSRQDKPGEALRKLRHFEARWSRTKNLWRLFTDHHEMDQVQLAIDRADVFLATKKIPEARSETSSLRFLITHIPEKECLNYKSVF